MEMGQQHLPSCILLKRAYIILFTSCKRNFEFKLYKTCVLGIDIVVRTFPSAWLITGDSRSLAESFN